jgi:hypothetical protein
VVADDDEATLAASTLNFEEVALAASPSTWPSFSAITTTL